MQQSRLLRQASFPAHAPAGLIKNISWFDELQCLQFGVRFCPLQWSAAAASRTVLRT